jgi:hypothetical protein
VAAIHVDRVRHRLERVERDPDGEDDAERPRRTVVSEAAEQVLG